MKLKSSSVRGKLIALVQITIGITLATISAVSSASPPSVVAQFPPSSGSGSDLAKLNLSRDQQEQIQQIQAETHNYMSEILTPEQMNQFQAGIAEGKRPPQLLFGLNLSRDQMTRIKEVMQDQQQQMSEILTPEQQEQFKQTQQSRPFPRGNSGI
jgi:Spy/CpxP family protein refolding chaperone